MLSSPDIIGGPLTQSQFFTTTKFADANPKVIAAIKAATFAAIDFIKKDTPAAVEIYREITKDKMSAEDILDMLKQPGMMEWIGGAARHDEIRGAPAQSGHAEDDAEGVDGLLPADHRRPSRQLTTRPRDERTVRCHARQAETVSTATLTTALFKRGLRNQFVQDVRPLNPAAGPMVGEAYTLRYIPAREDLNPITVFRDRCASAAQGGRGMPARRRARHRQSQGCARRVGGVDPRRAADEARRRRRRDRRRLSRLAGNRAARDSRPITIAPRRRRT